MSGLRVVTLNKRLYIQRRLAWSLSKNDTHNRGRDTPLFWIFWPDTVNPSQWKAVSCLTLGTLVCRYSTVYSISIGLLFQLPTININGDWLVHSTYEFICDKIFSSIKKQHKRWRVSNQEFTASLCCHSGISFFRRPWRMPCGWSIRFLWVRILSGSDNGEQPHLLDVVMTYQ